MTRARVQAGEFSAQLAELGAEVMELPVIRTAPPPHREELVDAIAELNSYQWLVFTSTNGVDWFFRHFFKAFEDIRDIGGTRIAAVGPATADRLRELHLKVDVLPKKHTAVEVARAMNNFETMENLKVCLFRAEHANEDLPRELTAAGAIVDDIAVYQTVAETEDRTGAGELLKEQGAEWLTFTSASTVEHFHQRHDLPSLLKKFPKLRVGSIGPETSNALKGLEIPEVVEAGEHTTAGLIAALVKATRKR